MHLKAPLSQLGAPSFPFAPLPVHELHPAVGSGNTVCARQVKGMVRGAMHSRVALGGVQQEGHGSGSSALVFSFSAFLLLHLYLHFL